MISLPTKTELQLKSRGILFVHNLFRNHRNVFGIVHRVWQWQVVSWAEFQNDWTAEKDITRFCDVWVDVEFRILYCSSPGLVVCKTRLQYKSSVAAPTPPIMVRPNIGIYYAVIQIWVGTEAGCMQPKSRRYCELLIGVII